MWRPEGAAAILRTTAKRLRPPLGVIGVIGVACRGHA